MATPGPSDHADRYSHDDDLKAPSRPGRPPRPSTEPDHAEEMPASGKTMTDPVTGEPIPAAR